MKKSTFDLLKKWLIMHDEIRAKFCVNATYERRGHADIIQTNQMHLQTKNHTFLRKSNLHEMYEEVIHDILQRHESIADNLEGLSLL